MASTVVGLDIGNGVIRAAEVADGGKGRPRLVRYRSIAIPPGAAQRGEVVERGTVASSLKQLWSTAGFSSKKVALGMGNHRVLVRDVAVPRMPLTRIRESLPFQVQELLPVPVADALLDFYPVSAGRSEAGDLVHGLLVAAVKEPVLANVETVQEAGLDPIEVDLIPFALARALLGDGDTARGSVALVHVGAAMTTVLVADDGTPQFVRIIPQGGDDVTAALTARLGIEADRAERIKRGLGLEGAGAGPEWRPAMEVIVTATGELLDSVRHTLSFYVNTHPGSTVERVLASGGGAQLTGFTRALAEATRLPVAVPDVLSRFTVARTVDVPAARAEPGGLPVAAGLAIGARP